MQLSPEVHEQPTPSLNRRPEKLRSTDSQAMQCTGLGALIACAGVLQRRLTAALVHPRALSQFCLGTTVFFITVRHQNQTPMLRGPPRRAAVPFWSCGIHGAKGFMRGSFRPRGPTFPA